MKGTPPEAARELIPNTTFAELMPTAKRQIPWIREVATEATESRTSLKDLDLDMGNGALGASIRSSKGHPSACSDSRSQGKLQKL